MVFFAFIGKLLCDLIKTIDKSAALRLFSNIIKDFAKP